MTQIQYGIACFAILLIYFIFIHKKKKQLIDPSLWLKEKEDNFNFYLIGKYFQNNIKFEKEYYQVITDKVSIDLDLDDVFKKIDRTTSKIGQQYLYYKTRVIHNSEEKLESFSKLVTFFNNNEKQRQECITELSKLKSQNGYFFEELLHEGLITNKKTAKICIYLNIAFISLIIATFYYPIFFFSLIPLFCANLFFHYKNKTIIDCNLNKITEFIKTHKTAQKIIAIDDYFEVHFEKPVFIKVLFEFRKRISIIQTDQLTNNELLMPLWITLEFLKITFNIEVILYNSYLQNFNKYKPELNQLFKFIGEIDSSISVSGLHQSGIKLSKPNYTNQKQLIIEDLYHPLINNCVSNSLELKNKSMLLTGSNMSGKTTFIRSLAINCIYSQSLNISFSKKFESPFLKIFSSIRTQDDINQSTSFYLDEVLTIKDFLHSAETNVPHLFILDEIFKGTNTLERIAIGKSVLSYLNTENNFVFVSTHDLELADLLQNDNFNLFHFSENVTDNELTFNYKLQQGKLQTKNAIRILNLYNYPEKIISEATEIYNNSLIMN
jgi:DNA mismatch repair ATPase MutS